MKRRDFNELIGLKFNKLTILEIIPKVKGINKERRCMAACECGIVKSIAISTIIKNSTKSCGYCRDPLRGKLFDGVKRRYSPIYRIYYGIKARCTNKNLKSYKNYGGRGITLCAEWDSDFNLFYTWCKENGWSKELDIDREDNNGNYTPDNCRFVTRKVNTRNRRNNVNLEFKGQTKTLAEWCENLNLNRSKIIQRLKSGTPVEEIFTNLIKPNKQNNGRK